MVFEIFNRENKKDLLQNLLLFFKKLTLFLHMGCIIVLEKISYVCNKKIKVKINLDDKTFYRYLNVKKCLFLGLVKRILQEV